VGLGLKQKYVSSLVQKWQQIQNEIKSQVKISDLTVNSYFCDECVDFTTMCM